MEVLLRIQFPNGVVREELRRAEQGEKESPWKIPKGAEILRI